MEMNGVLSAFSLLLLTLPASASFTTNVLNSGQSPSRFTLNANTIYEVNGHVTDDVPARPGESAMVAPANGVVVLNLKSGSVLTLHGGNGLVNESNNTGGGAGLLVPAGSTVYITGEGTIIAEGGAATGGQSGGNANDAYEPNDKDVCSGRGGAGGRGGWGGGAGIGGTGGRPGDGGSRPDLEQRYTDSDTMPCVGSGGRQGGAGGKGSDAGTVYVVDHVRVNAAGGKGGGKGGGGGGSTWAWHHTTGSWS